MEIGDLLRGGLVEVQREGLAALGELEERGGFEEEGGAVWGVGYGVDRNPISIRTAS